MNHADHVRLIQPAFPNQPQADAIWADFGSGRGAFTLAMADCMSGVGTIHAIDRDRRALMGLQTALSAQYAQIDAHYHAHDFVHPIELPPLDGIVMANSLHFIKDKSPVLQLIHQYLKPEGKLVMVEYDTDKGNRYVPYPMSYTTWANMAKDAGFAHTQRIGSRSSSFMGAFFSAMSEG